VGVITGAKLRKAVSVLRRISKRNGMQVETISTFMLAAATTVAKV